MKDNKSEPKDRILDAATALFAQRGYSAVGVREIANAAGVNISMISYYYNGKIGILKEIIRLYFEENNAIISQVLDAKLEPIASLKRIIFEQVNMIKNKTNLCKVALMELPLDSPELAEYKNQLYVANHQLIQESFHKNRPIAEDPFYKCVIGPAMQSLIFSHFLVGNIVHAECKVEFNDDFYERYADTISLLFLRGVQGIGEEVRKRLSDTKPHSHHGTEIHHPH